MECEGRREGDEGRGKGRRSESWADGGRAVCACFKFLRCYQHCLLHNCSFWGGKKKNTVQHWKLPLGYTAQWGGFEDLWSTIPPFLTWLYFHCCRLESKNILFFSPLTLSFEKFVTLIHLWGVFSETLLILFLFKLMKCSIINSSCLYMNLQEPLSLPIIFFLIFPLLSWHVICDSRFLICPSQLLWRVTVSNHPGLPHSFLTCL